MDTPRIRRSNCYSQRLERRSAEPEELPLQPGKSAGRMPNRAWPGLELVRQGAIFPAPLSFPFDFKVGLLTPSWAGALLLALRFSYRKTPGALAIPGRDITPPTPHPIDLSLASKPASLLVCLGGCPRTNV